MRRLDTRQSVAVLDLHSDALRPETLASEPSRSDTIDRLSLSRTPAGRAVLHPFFADGPRMAIYRFEAKIIKRSAGRSATAAAAYRAATFIADERSGLAFNYSRKRGMLHCEIIAPAGAPGWVRDRARLWNAVEQSERRKDAQLARDLVLCLPFELTHEQRVELVREFVGEVFVARGMVADIAIHAPDHRGDDRNHHAHVLLTMRGLSAVGFGPKVRAWNDVEELEGWREQWAVAVNAHLARAGHEARVDHRSLAEQGIEREPEPKQGAVATAMERDGNCSHAGEDRRAAKKRNRQREDLSAELDEVVTELETGEGSAVSRPRTQPARKVQRSAWARYLFDLWRRVAREITKPIVSLAREARRRLTGRKRVQK
ncbi:MAG: MobQ family relaxase, partial [Rhizomicrobium sp.]